MPMAAPKPCTVCRALVRDGGSRCELHKKKESNFSRKLSRHERGYGTAWDKLRPTILRRDGGMCVPCKAAGRLKLGGIVDHINPKAEGGSDDPGNLQTICKPCHDLKTALESARGGKGVSMMPDWLPMPKVPVTVVCGPPGSGKSTYVREHAGPADLVLDVDDMAAQLTGKPLYHASHDEVMAAIRLRNHRLACLAESTSTVPRAWLIVTAPTAAAREFWQTKLNAELHVVRTPKVECVQRIRADVRRPADVQKAGIEAVYRWE